MYEDTSDESNQLHDEFDLEMDCEPQNKTPKR